jgi:hypothetical protein
MQSPEEQLNNHKSEGQQHTEHQQHSMKESVLASIQSGKVKMHPRWEFAMRAAAIYLGLLILVVGSLYAASFAVFMLRQSGLLSASHFGFEGLAILLGSLPWIIVVVAIIFALILLFTIRRYSFGYTWPFLYSALAIIVFVIIGGVIIGITPLHQQLESIENHLPLAGGFYQQEFENLPQNFTIGRIVTITSKGCTMEDKRYGQVAVIISPQTQLPASKLQVGERIIVLGQRMSSQVQANAIRVATGDAYPDGDDMPMGMPAPPQNLQPQQNIPQPYTVPQY